jgi:vacuolar-type H+-ATPase subunit H
MARVQEPLDSTVTEMERIIQEYRERIVQALETDCSRMKEEAESESNQIIARAQEDAERAVTQARQAARVESERIIAGAKEEAAKITRKSREEAQQESARVVSETREKTSQIISEAVERSTTQAQSEFARVAAEARSQAYQLLTQVSKLVEQIIAETETNIKTELERFTTDIVESEMTLRPYNEAPEKEAEINSQQVIEEEISPDIPAKEKEEPIVLSAGEKRIAPMKEVDEPKLFKGRLKLEMVPPYNQERLEGLPEWLARIPGLTVLSTGSYAGANKWITTYNINLEQPVPLLKILKAVPKVKDVSEHKGNVVITLK